MAEDILVLYYNYITSGCKCTVGLISNHSKFVAIVMHVLYYDLKTALMEQLGTRLARGSLLVRLPEAT